MISSANKTIPSYITKEHKVLKCDREQNHIGQLNQTEHVMQ